MIIGIATLAACLVGPPRPIPPTITRLDAEAIHTRFVVSRHRARRHRAWKARQRLVDDAFHSMSIGPFEALLTYGP